MFEVSEGFARTAFKAAHLQRTRASRALRRNKETRASSKVTGANKMRQLYNHAWNVTPIAMLLFVCSGVSLGATMFVKTRIRCNRSLKPARVYLCVCVCVFSFDSCCYIVVNNQHAAPHGGSERWMLNAVEFSRQKSGVWSYENA